MIANPDSDPAIRVAPPLTAFDEDRHGGVELAADGVGAPRRHHAGARLEAVDEQRDRRDERDVALDDALERAASMNDACMIQSKPASTASATDWRDGRGS